MHALIVLRHAQALAAPADGTDMARVLSPSGREQADAAGRWLLAHGAQPERIVCSPAVRTMDTAQRVARELGDVPVCPEAGVYAATPGELIALLDAYGDSGQVLLVGHNPGLEQLLSLLVQGSSDSGRGLPPAGLAWITLQAALEPGGGELKAYWEP